MKLTKTEPWKPMMQEQAKTPGKGVLTRPLQSSPITGPQGILPIGGKGRVEELVFVHDHKGGLQVVSADRGQGHVHFVAVLKGKIKNP